MRFGTLDEEFGDPGRGLPSVTRRVLEPSVGVDVEGPAWVAMKAMSCGESKQGCQVNAHYLNRTHVMTSTTSVTRAMEAKTTNNLVVLYGVFSSLPEEN